jgi:hypothetical protein
MGSAEADWWLGTIWAALGATAAAAPPATTTRSAKKRSASFMMAILFLNKFDTQKVISGDERIVVQKSAQVYTFLLLMTVVIEKITIVTRTKTGHFPFRN